jgi:hypothetical protein
LIAHRSIVSLGFRISSLLIGVPAVVALVGFTAIAIDFRHLGAPDSAHTISIHTYGIAGIMTDAAVWFDRLFGALSRLAEWLFVGLAIVALLVTLQAVLLFVVGRGIGRGAMWARIVGGLLAVGLAMLSFIAFASLPHRLMTAPLPLLALALYTLWTLIWRYKAPTAIAPPEAAAEVIAAEEPGR